MELIVLERSALPSEYSWCRVSGAAGWPPRAGHGAEAVAGCWASSPALPWCFLCWLFTPVNVPCSPRADVFPSCLWAKAMPPWYLTPLQLQVPPDCVAGKRQPLLQRGNRGAKTPNNFPGRCVAFVRELDGGCSWWCLPQNPNSSVPKVEEIFPAEPVRFMVFSFFVFSVECKLWW